jgi:OmpR family response regulator RpaB
MRKKVLIVDDQASTRKFLGSYLSHYYDIILAASGQEAIQILQKGGDPDLIITDVLMPEMNGEEFILKARSFKKDMPPVLVLSSVENSSVKINFFELGAADYVQKPFNPEELKFRIKNAIRK